MPCERFAHTKSSETWKEERGVPPDDSANNHWINVTTATPVKNVSNLISKKKIADFLLFFLFLN